MDNLDARGILNKWLKRSRESQLAHYLGEEQNSRRHLWVGLPAALLSAVVGTTVFTALDAREDVDVRLRIVIAMTAILAAILTGCQTFLRFSAKADEHLAAATKFAAIRRRIEEVLTFPDPIASELVSELRTAIDAITEAAPNVSARLFVKARDRANRASDDEARTANGQQ